MTPTHPRKKFTAANLAQGVSLWRMLLERYLFVQNVSRFNDETPSGPNYAGGCESDVLGKGETLGWSSKVTNAGEDNAPLSSNQLRCSIGIMKVRRRTFMTGALKDFSN